MVLACAFSVYSLPAALTVLTLLTLRRQSISKGQLASLLAAALLGTLLFFMMSRDGGAREEIGIASLLQALVAGAAEAPERLFDGYWQTSGGLLADRVGSLRFVESRKAILGGLFLSSLCMAGAARARRQPPISNSDPIPLQNALLALLLGLLPIILSGRDLGPGIDSRYLLPLLPLAASLPVVVLYRILPDRTALAASVLVIFTSGYWFEIAMERYLDRNQAVDSAARAFTLYESNSPRPGEHAVVLMDLPEARWPLEPPTFYELTARLRNHQGDGSTVLAQRGTELGFERFQLDEKVRRSIRDVVFFDAHPDRVFLVRQEGAGWAIRERGKSSQTP